LSRVVVRVSRRFSRPSIFTFGAKNVHMTSPTTAAGGRIANSDTRCGLLL